MNSDTLNRRTVLTGAIAAAALIPMRKVIAQTASGGGDWFDMIKAQHVAILAQVAAIIANDGNGNSLTEPGVAQLAYLLTAHNTAEENVVYPMMASIGMWVPADVLYLEQSHGKIMNFTVDTDVDNGVFGATFIAHLQALQAGLVEHATVHEEGDYFPKLHAALSAQQNAQLTAAYQVNYNAVTATF